VTTSISTRVLADDPVSEAGIIAQLRHRPEVELADDNAGAAVVIVVVDEVDEVATRMMDLSLQHQSQVAVVVTRLDDAGMFAALEAGACGLLRRNEASPDSLVGLIQAAAKGAGSVPPDLLGRLLNQLGRLQRQVLAPRGITMSGLSGREIEVLRLVADGYETSEIAGRLAYSERTIKNVIHDVTSRLRLRNRTHAVAWSVREGLI
jgi:DNA-binding NarL/FixJ family response regulator